MFLLNNVHTKNNINMEYQEGALSVGDALYPMPK